MAKRNFLIIGHRAHTVADWKLDDICGVAGRLDVLVRSITASLWKSHGIRRDTDVWLSLRGKPKPDITIHFSGKNIKHYKKSSNSDTFSKNENSSKRSNRFLINSAKNKNFNN